MVDWIRCIAGLTSPCHFLVYLGWFKTIKALVRCCPRRARSLTGCCPVCFGSPSTLIDDTAAQHGTLLAHDLLTCDQPLTPVTWMSPEQVTLDGDNGEHLLNGITSIGFMVLMDLLGFRDGGNMSNAKTALRGERHLAFADAFSRDVVCGYDLQCDIKRELVERNLQQASMAEIMKSQNHRAAGKAQDFLSHGQGEALHTTLTAMIEYELMRREARIMFVDYAVLRQGRKDFNLTKVRSAIKTIGSTVMLLDPPQSPFLLSRIFCIFEIGSTVVEKVNLTAICPSAPFQEFTGNRRHLGNWGNVGLCDVRSAEARDPADKTKILSYVDDNFGIDEANTVVGTACLVGLLSQLIRSSKYPVDLEAITEVLPRLGREQLRELLMLRSPTGMTALQIAIDNWPDEKAERHSRQWLQKLDPAARQEILMTAHSPGGETLLSGCIMDEKFNTARTFLDLAADATQLLDTPQPCPFRPFFCLQSCCGIWACSSMWVACSCWPVTPRKMFRAAGLQHLAKADASGIAATSGHAEAAQIIGQPVMVRD